jgi:hypothetical protein
MQNFSIAVDDWWWISTKPNGLQLVRISKISPEGNVVSLGKRFDPTVNFRIEEVEFIECIYMNELPDIQTTIGSINSDNSTPITHHGV